MKQFNTNLLFASKVLDKYKNLLEENSSDKTDEIKALYITNTIIKNKSVYFTKSDVKFALAKVLSMKNDAIYKRMEYKKSSNEYKNLDTLIKALEYAQMALNLRYK